MLKPKIIQKLIYRSYNDNDDEFSHMGGSRGTAKSLKECEVIMILPYIVKYALLRIAMSYF